MERGGNLGETSGCRLPDLELSDSESSRFEGYSLRVWLLTGLLDSRTFGYFVGFLCTSPLFFHPTPSH